MSDIADDVLAHFGLEVDDELKHYGIKGMRWGVVRDRGANGRVDRTQSADHIESRSLAKKRQSEMSNAELRRVNERLQLEKQNKDLQTRGSLNKIKAGTAIAGTVIAVATTATTVYNLVNSPAGKAAVIAGKRAYNKHVNKAIALGPA